MKTFASIAPAVIAALVIAACGGSGSPESRDEVSASSTSQALSLCCEPVRGYCPLGKPICPVPTITAISSGNQGTCAVLSNGEAKCWGGNTSGQLGDNTTNSGANKTPTIVHGLGYATSISAGLGHTCALLWNGTAECWGLNQFGELGDGTTVNRLLPVEVKGLTDITAISDAHNEYTCALLSNGTVDCWGDGVNGWLGDGSDHNSLTPVAVSGVAGATAISTGASHACALLSNGTVKCWGLNDVGEIGNGKVSGNATCPGGNPCQTVPVSVHGLSSAVAISTGTDHTCALLSNDTVECWGDSGLDDSRAFSDVPVAVPGLSGVVAISAGGFFSCALLSDGAVKCWGYNPNGELGDGTLTDSSTPVSVKGLSGRVVAISAGDFSSCALLSTGKVQCWGDDTYGELGADATRVCDQPAAAATGPCALSAVTVEF